MSSEDAAWDRRLISDNRTDAAYGASGGRPDGGKGYIPPSVPITQDPRRSQSRPAETSAAARAMDLRDRFQASRARGEGQSPYSPPPPQQASRPMPESEMPLQRADSDEPLASATQFSHPIYKELYTLLGQEGYTPEQRLARFRQYIANNVNDWPSPKYDYEQEILDIATKHAEIRAPPAPKPAAPAPTSVFKAPPPAPAVASVAVPAPAPAPVYAPRPTMDLSNAYIAQDPATVIGTMQRYGGGNVMYVADSQQGGQQIYSMQGRDGTQTIVSVGAQQSQQQQQGYLYEARWTEGARSGKIRQYYSSHGRIMPVETSGTTLIYVPPHPRTTLPIKNNDVDQQILLQTHFKKQGRQEVDAKSCTLTFIPDSELLRQLTQLRDSIGQSYPVCIPPDDISCGKTKEALSKTLFNGPSLSDALQTTGLQLDAGGRPGCKYTITSFDLGGSVGITVDGQPMPVKVSIQMGDKYGSPQIIRQMVTEGFVASFSDTSAPMNPRAMLSESVLEPRTNGPCVVDVQYPQCTLRGVVGEFGPQITLSWPSTAPNTPSGKIAVHFNIDLGLNMRLYGKWAQSTVIIPRLRIVGKDGKKGGGGFDRVPNSNETVWDGLYWPKEAERDRTMSSSLKGSYGTEGSAASRLMSAVGANYNKQNTMVRNLASVQSGQQVGGGSDEVVKALRDVSDKVVKATTKSTSELKKSIDASAKIAKKSFEMKKKSAKKSGSSSGKKSGGKKKGKVTKISGGEIEVKATVPLKSKDGKMVGKVTTKSKVKKSKLKKAKRSTKKKVKKSGGKRASSRGVSSGFSSRATSMGRRSSSASRKKSGKRR